MAQGRSRIIDDPPGIDEDSIVDLDEDPVPELYVLEASGLTIRKDRVYSNVNRRYTQVMKILANDAEPGYALKSELENDRDAIPAVDIKTFLFRHRTVWYPRIGRAVRDARKEFKEVEALAGRYVRRLETRLHGRIVAEAKGRFDRAVEIQERAKLLSKNLIEYERSQR